MTVHVAPSTEAYLAEFFKLLDATKTPLTSVSIPDIFFGGGFFPQKLTIPSPQTATKLCALNLFFSRDSELQINHGNLLLMDNNDNFMPKMQQNSFDGLDPLVELMHSPRHPSHNGGILLRRGRERERG